jgi:hypothetical protein
MIWSPRHGDTAFTESCALHRFQSSPGRKPAKKRPHPAWRSAAAPPGKRKMTRDQTCGEIDLSLPIEGVERSGADCLRIGWQVIERLAAIAGDAGWRHI